MFDVDDVSEGILVRLRQEFIETANDQLEDIDGKLDQLDSGQGKAEEILLSVQRDIHNIKGQGPTFGFPLTGRVAHMLEDYLINAGGIGAENIADIRIYLGLMVNLIATAESIGEDDPKNLLKTLPTGQEKAFSDQHAHDVTVLLVMPAGLQRKMMAKELLSCGFRVMSAYDCVEALSVAVDITPDIVFINYDMVPFTGRELSKVLVSVDTLSDIHIVLLTSYEAGDEHLQDLPDNVSVVKKQQDFTEAIGEFLIKWGVFGKLA